MLKLDYFRRRNFTLPMLASALMQYAYMGGFVVTPALLGSLYGLTVGAIAGFMPAMEGRPDHSFTNLICFLPAVIVSAGSLIVPAAAGFAVGVGAEEHPHASHRANVVSFIARNSHNRFIAYKLP